MVKKIYRKSIIFFHVFLFFFENFKNLISTRKNKITILQGTKCTREKNLKKFEIKHSNEVLYKILQL